MGMRVLPGSRNVVFDLEVVDDYPPVASEGVWCTLTPDGNFRVDNLPFYVPGLALGDTVSAEEEDGVLFATGVVAQAGHSTLRIAFFDESVVEGVRSTLQAMGCAWESMKGGSFTTVDVPPDVVYADVLAFLSTLADADELDYEESCIQHS